VPENDPYQNAPHLQPRLAVQEGSHPPGIGQHEISSAIALEQYIRDGDLGAARKFLHEAEYRLGVWRPDPWRLLEHLAELAVTRLSGVASGAQGAGDVSLPRSDMAAGSEGGPARDWSPPAAGRAER
jgi:hypothetical protein